MSMSMSEKVQDAFHELVFEYGEDTIIEDDVVMEKAGWLVPDMHGEILKEYEACSVYDSDWYGGGYDIFAQMRAAIHESYYYLLFDLVAAHNAYAERD